MTLASLVVGSKYPFKIKSEGAVSNFLHNERNLLLIAIPNIEKVESIALKKGKMRCGVLSKNGAILLIYQFFDKKGKPVFTLDSPFNVRLIDKPDLHNIDNDKKRLAIEIHIVDSASNLVKGLRYMTMSNALSIEFLSAVMDQIANKSSDKFQHMKWMQQRPDELSKLIKMYTLGL